MFAYLKNKEGALRAAYLSKKAAYKSFWTTLSLKLFYKNDKSRPLEGLLVYYFLQGFFGCSFGEKFLVIGKAQPLSNDIEYDGWSYDSSWSCNRRVFQYFLFRRKAFRKNQVTRVRVELPNTDLFVAWLLFLFVPEWYCLVEVSNTWMVFFGKQKHNSL